MKDHLKDFLYIVRVSAPFYLTLALLFYWWLGNLKTCGDLVSGN